MALDVRRGDIVYANLEPIVGHETGKTRPVLVIQNDVGNRFSPTTIVAAITEYSAKKASYPVCATVPEGEGGLTRKSVVNCSQIRTLDRERLIAPVLGLVSEATMQDVDAALRVSLAL